MTVRKTREMQEILKSFEVIGIYWERERDKERKRERESNLYKIQTGRICRWARWVGQTYP